MAKVVAPLFGFSASGQLGKSIVNAQWRGRPYVRRYTIPANPRTLAQTTQRNLFRWLQAVWKQAPVLVEAPWTEFAKGQALTNRNAWTQHNAKAMFGDTDLSHFSFSNGAKGGLPPSGVVATPASGEISVAYVLPTPPPSWAVADVVAAVIPAQDPTSDTIYVSVAADDPTATTPLVIPGLTNGTAYVGGIWLVWTKPDGSLAYSSQVPFLGTPA